MKSLVPLATMILTAGLLVSGCQQRRDVDVEPTPGTPGADGQVEQPTGENVEDATITTKVKSALVASPQVGALSIDVDTTANIVTLSGTVNSAAQKQEAEQIARGIEGVTSVVNNLVVQ